MERNKMHSMNNIKFTDAQQTKVIYNSKNFRTNAAIWYKKCT
jgi:hypothetical protein